MITDNVLTTVGIVFSAAIAAGGWFWSRRRDERDDLLRDFKIRDRLDEGPVRDRLDESIDERVMVLAERSERRRYEELGSFGWALFWLGLSGFWWGVTQEHVAVGAWSLLLLVASIAVWIVGARRFSVPDKRRKTPRRTSSAAEPQSDEPDPGEPVDTVP